MRVPTQQYSAPSTSGSAHQDQRYLQRPMQPGRLSLLALSLAAALSSPSVWAASPGSSTTGYEWSTQDSSDLTIAAGVVINPSSDVGVSISAGSYGTMTNLGTVSGQQGVSITNGVYVGLINNDTGGSISGVSAGIFNSGTIGSLSNSADISGGSYGIYNDAAGSISELTNNVHIAGSYGVNNLGTITNFVNGGIISGSAAGILNTAVTSAGSVVSVGTIGTLINGGTIMGQIGVQNTGLIGSLNNSGLVSGLNIGILNDVTGSLAGTIGTLSNSNVISGTTSGLVNNGTIFTLFNGGVSVSGSTTIAAGTITGSSNGIANFGLISNFNNGGLISSAFTGLANGNTSANGAAATISTLINSGTIYGGSGALSNNLTGTIGVVSNSGLIQGSVGAAINNGGLIASLTNSATGTIAGGYVGISNDGGTIQTLTNSGRVSATNGSGLYNNGTIGTLNNSGLITGSNFAIYLDAGSSLTSFVNTGTIAGTINNISGTLLNIIGGSGSSFGTLTGVSGGISASDVGTIISSSSGLGFSRNQLLNDNIDVGSGTVTNSGVLQVNNPLTITGNYVQGAGSTLAIGVSNPVFTGNLLDTGYGRLVVQGSATLDGSTITVKSAGYALAQGQRYVVVAANNGLSATGAIYSATGYSATGTIVTDTSDASYRDLVLTLGGATGNSAVNSATNSNASSSLAGLFKYSGTNALMLAMFNPAAALDSPAAANKAGSQLSPAAVSGAATQAVGASTQSVNNVATSHMDGFRVAQNGDSGVATGEATNSVGLWGQFFDGRATQGLRDGIAGYHGNFRGLLLGADSLVTDNVRAGGLFSAAKVSVASDGDNTGSSASVNNYGLTAYATYSGSPWYVNVLAGVARQQYGTVRAISYTGFSGIANGNFNGQQYSTSVQAGYPLNLDAWLPGATLTPIAGLSFSSLRQNGYSETGGNGAALTVNASSTNSLKSELGAKLEKSFDTSYGKLLPSAQLGWRHEYKDGRTQSGASFSADSTGSTAFVTQSATPVSNLAVLNLGVTLAQSKNLNLSAGYTLESGGGYTAQTGSVQVRWQY